MWPAGLCLPGGDRLIDAAGTACVCWEKDWRGVDQSDGVAERDEVAVDPVERNEDPKPESPRYAGVLLTQRFKQPELF